MGILAQPAAVLLDTALSEGHFVNGALYQGVGAGFATEHGDRRTSNMSDPQGRDINPLLPKYPQGGVSGEAIRQGIVPQNLLQLGWISQRAVHSARIRLTKCIHADLLQQPVEQVKKLTQQFTPRDCKALHFI